MGTKCVSISGVEVIRRRTLASSAGTQLGKAGIATGIPATSIVLGSGVKTCENAAQVLRLTIAPRTGVCRRSGADIGHAAE